jgi:putative FmdB family regulatory protein
VITYEFKCDACDSVHIVFEEPQKIHETEHFCHVCGKKMRRLYSSPSIRVSFRAGHDPYTGENFESQRARERYMAENGIIKAA